MFEWVNLLLKIFTDKIYLVNQFILISLSIYLSLPYILTIVLIFFHVPTRDNAAWLWRSQETMNLNPLNGDSVQGRVQDDGWMRAVNEEIK